MNFQPLFGSYHPIAIHASAATLAIGLGGAQFVLPKGTSLHRCLGYVWVTLMASVAITGLFIHEILMISAFSPIHLLSLLVLVTLVWAVRAAKNALVSRQRTAMIMLYIFGLLLAGACSFPRFECFMLYSLDDVIALSAQSHLPQLTDASEYLQWSCGQSCSTRTVGWDNLKC